MSLRNPYGDVEVTDPRAMRALAHPVRLALLSRLQRHGPATATRLSEHVDASPSVVSWHLRHLASFGLVTDAEDPEGDRRRRWWKAVAGGFRFEMPATPQGESAARLLRAQMVDEAVGQLSGWLSDVEPGLDTAWRRLAGSANTSVRVTRAEARRLERDIEALLAPYVTRDEHDVPASARGVRVLRFVLPEGQQ